ncbi:MAG: SelL-related redox protein [Bryobacter sp.]|nr:SelL-related redox protein [Bryobacter sp.]
MSQPFPAWMKLTLAAAGFYNILWGASVVLFPGFFFSWAGMAAPNYPEIWQCVGMIVGVYGLGYWFASSDPLTHWPITFVGLLGKILGPLGFAKALYEGRFSPKFGWLILTNDLIWWIPFGLILYNAFKVHNDNERQFSPEVQSWALRAKTQFGISIIEHSRLRPVLLVFLRHVGCTFCREALSDLSRHRAAIEASGTQIVLVHMGREEAAEQILSKYNLTDVPRVADPTLSLYEAFGLERGSFAQLLGPKVWLRGFQAGLLGKHGIGPSEGDVSQMPGVFLVFHGETLKSYRHQSAADRPDYLALVEDLSGIPNTQVL